MYRFFCAVLLSFVLCLAPIAGFGQESERGVAAAMADGVAYVILKTAWPTAKYENCEFERVRVLNGGGKEVLFKINARSFWTDGPLWLQIIVETDSNFKPVGIRYGDYKAVFPPNTAIKTWAAMAESNNK